MDQPLTKWICDLCGKQIIDTLSGVVAWRTNPQLQYHAFKILHKGACLAGSGSDQFRELGAFPGIDGLSYVLGWLSQGPIARNQGRDMYCNVADLDEYADLLRRLYIPHYEQARPYFNDQRVLQYHAQSDEYSPYTVEQFMRLLDLVHPQDIPAILLERPKRNTISEWLPLSDRQDEPRKPRERRR